MKCLLNKALPLLLAACPLPLLAGPLEVSSDSAWGERGQYVHEGSVVAVQDQRRIVADRLEARTDQNNQLTRAVATGSPVELTEGTALAARAERLEYDARNGVITLHGNAWIRHDGRTFEGAVVVYDLRTESVQARSEAGQRVRLVIPAGDLGSTAPEHTEAPAPDAPHPAREDTP